MVNNFPANLYSYFRENPDDFEERTIKSRQNTYWIIVGVCLILLFFKGGFLFKLIILFVMLFFVLLGFMGGKSYYSKKSKGKINLLAIKIFNQDEISEDEIIEMFENDDFTGLAQAPEIYNKQFMQLHIQEDEKGNTFYMQLMKHVEKNEFRGCSEVKVVSDPVYSENYQTIKKIHSTK